MDDKQTRTIAKTITYRIIIVIGTFIFIDVIVDNKIISLAVVIVTNLFSMVVYYIHERIWLKIRWGRE